MKKQLSLFVWAVAVFGMAPVWAATNSGSYGASSADLSGGNPGVRTRTNVNYEKYETRSSTKTYTAKDGKNMYYTQPASRSALYKDYSGGNVRQENVRTTRTETARTTAKRKYYLAHPFFQPLKGKFGSVTDLAYTASSYDVNLTPAPGWTISDANAAWDMSRISVKEDLSFGITDRLAVLGMVQYDSSKYTMDWSTAPDDTMKDNGINLYGLGLQYRFVDNAEWIGMLSGYYQHQVDIADTFILDLKGGYKVGSSTIYGLARGWLVDFKGNSYGNGVTDGNTSMFIAYDTDVSSVFYIEGGVGVFSVVDEDWTLNGELVFGDYGWHNQASLKGAIGWQPGNSFALNLYAKTAIYDSADDKDLGFWWNEPGVTTGWEYAGNANISNYAEWTIGLQAILYF